MKVKSIRNTTETVKMEGKVVKVNRVLDELRDLFEILRFPNAGHTSALL